MKHLRDGLIGFLLGVVLCVWAFELIHVTVEWDGQSFGGQNFCGSIYDRLGRRLPGELLYSWKLTYKVLAWPMKTLTHTVWVALSDQAMAVNEGEGWTVQDLR